MIASKLPDASGHPLLDAQQHALATGSGVSIVGAGTALLSDSMSTMQTQCDTAPDAVLAVTVPNASLLGDSMSTMQTQADAAPDAADLPLHGGLPDQGLSSIPTALDGTAHVTVTVPHGHLLGESMSTMQTMPTE